MVCSASRARFRPGLLSLPGILLVCLVTLNCGQAEHAPTATVAGRTGGALGTDRSSGGSPATGGSATGGVVTPLSGSTLASGGASPSGGSGIGGTPLPTTGGSSSTGNTTVATRAGTNATGGTSQGGTNSPTGGVSGRSNTLSASQGSSAGKGTPAASSAGTTGLLQPSECQAFWGFDQLVDGKVADLSGHNQSLTLSQATLVEGPRGNHLKLAGSNTSATAPSPVIDATANFSISVWVKLDQLDAYNTIVSQDGQNVSSFFLQKRNSNRLALTTFPADSVDAMGCITEGAIQPRIDEWYHLVATRNAATREQRLYVDGMLSGKSTCAGGFATNAPLVVGRGRWQGPVDWLAGGVDELCLQNRVLTPEQVVDRYLQGRTSGSNFLFAYFAEQAEGRGDGLRLAQSHDALYWGAVGGGKVFITPTVGGKSFRDPHVMRDPAGIYHVVWTTSCVPWALSGCVQDKGFGHAQSTDMVHFTAPTYVPIALNVEHVWAPETLYDLTQQQYMVYWSSPIDNAPNAADPHSIYYMLTKDWVTFGTPTLLYSRSGRNFIDATITTQQSGGYVMFLKDEADGQKNIRALTSSALYGTGAWTTDPSSPLTGSYAAEGPSAIVSNGQTYLFFDKYGDGKYGALRSTGVSNLTAPSTWTDISSSVFFAGVRHGTPIEVPDDVYRAVALKAGE